MIPPITTPLPFFLVRIAPERVPITGPFAALLHPFFFVTGVVVGAVSIRLEPDVSLETVRFSDFDVPAPLSPELALLAVIQPN